MVGTLFLAPCGVLQAQDTPVAPEARPTSDFTRSPSATVRQQTDTEPLPSAFGHQDRTEDYSGWLIASYLTAPLLGIGVPVSTGSWSAGNTTIAVAVTGAIAVAVTLPSIVHFLHGETRLGVRSLIAFPLIAAVAVIGGAMLGAELAREPPSVDDSAAMVGGLLGMMTGAAVATLGWGAFDVISTTGVRRARRDRQTARFGVAAVPTKGGGMAALYGRF